MQSSALYQTGNRLLENGRKVDALNCYLGVLDQEPYFAEAYFKLGSIYHDQNKLEKALEHYSLAAKLKPDFTEAFYNAGLVLQALGRYDNAINYYESALELCPNLAEAYNNLGQLYKENDIKKAVECFQRAIEFKPNFAEPHFNIGDIFLSKGDVGPAIHHFQKAIEIKPILIEAHNNLGIAFKTQGNIDAAIECYRKVIHLNPVLAEGYYNLGSALREKKYFQEAIVFLKKALQLKPDYAEAHTNLGLTYKNMGDLGPALHNFTLALQKKPDLAVAHWNRAFTHLLDGNFDKGWEDFEWRFKQPKWKSLYPFRLNGQLWGGTPCTGKTIFVHDEQGLGDTLQFIRYLPMLKECCDSVILETRKPLINLLNGFPGLDKIVERSTDGKPKEPYDYYVPLLSLPYIFKTTLDTIPTNIPYIFADTKKAAYWSERLRGQEKKIGIVWAGRPEHTNDHNRSVRLDQFESIMKIRNIKFYGLQKGPAAIQTKTLENKAMIVNIGEEFDDFTDTAAVIHNLDLVISVDTSVAHLAGAMGKPIWVLVPFIPDWRWMMNREDSPWYPSMRLFRQTEPGNWHPVIDRILSKLSKTNTV